MFKALDYDTKTANDWPILVEILAPCTDTPVLHLTTDS